MKLYHVTTCDRARTILRQGFHDNVGSYGADRQLSGVWLSDKPLDCNDTGNVIADAILAVSIDCELDDLSMYECVEDGRSYREWLVPADFVNKRTVAIVQMGEDIWAS
jgi:hypothetical protein